MKNIPELDGLRGMGAVLVVAFHWDPTYVFWAWSFVPMFFVLSAFLITRIVLEDLLVGRFSLRHFYIRRILRIWPVYYAALAAIFVYYVLVHGTAFFDSPHFTDWLMSLVYLQYTQQYVGHIGNPWFIYEFLPGMQPLWTLAIEEQFYLILPIILLLVVPRLGLLSLACLCVLAAMIAMYVRVVGLPPTLLLSQLDNLALGVLLAVIFTITERGPTPTRRKLMIGGFIAAIAFALLMWTPYLIEGYRGLTAEANPLLQTWLWGCAGLFYFGVIGLIAMFPESRATALLRSPPFLYAGSVSYALYLFHAPIMIFIIPRISRWLGPDLKWLSVILGIAVMWALVHASRELLERPALKLKKYFPSGREQTSGTAA